MLQDVKGSFQVESSIALEEKLNERYGSGVNAFWLSHQGNSGATLLILVNNDLANLTYFPPGKYLDFNHKEAFQAWMQVDSVSSI